MCTRSKFGGTAKIQKLLSFKPIQMVNAVQLIIKQGHTVVIQITTYRNT